MSELPVILLLSGSLRAASSNNALLRTAEVVAPERVRTVRYDGMASLPHFNPDDDNDPLPTPVAELRAAIAGATAVLVCAPEYAGTLPGAFKNLLDWTIGGTETSDKPVAWVNVAAPGRGEGAEATLRSVLAYTGTRIVESACVRIPVAPGMISDGVIADPAVRQQLRDVLARLVESPQSASNPAHA
ncbi:NADPH-dependent FMN reductase [Streptoalloteichus hindustanus]|uniref:NAD(P)H-dependent FMN reductase n=1 Tax=Streptoalloteichus hindustanus TaxID=2017 RepID=A0A1M4Z4T5_STRHI|nr:NADPH-dependent FMN reductase [Streptoalloteichus hindustanus]SHF12958.1 NAD(P)H-dependent FMN reductase [Streptoalloteichus hindustanus]